MVVIPGAQIGGGVHYAQVSGWLLAPAWLDGREVLGAYRDQHDAQPSYFIAYL